MKRGAQVSWSPTRIRGRDLAFSPTSSHALSSCTLYFSLFPFSQALNQIKPPLTLFPLREMFRLLLPTSVSLLSFKPHQTRLFLRKTWRGHSWLSGWPCSSLTMSCMVPSLHLSLVRLGACFLVHHLLFLPDYKLQKAGVGTAIPSFTQTQDKTVCGNGNTGVCLPSWSLCLAGDRPIKESHT